VFSLPQLAPSAPQQVLLLQRCIAASPALAAASQVAFFCEDAGTCSVHWTRHSFEAVSDFEHRTFFTVAAPPGPIPFKLISAAAHRRFSHFDRRFTCCLILRRRWHVLRVLETTQF
jgi:hypothetical protein